MLIELIQNSYKTPIELVYNLCTKKMRLHKDLPMKMLVQIYDFAEMDSNGAMLNSCKTPVEELL